MPIRLDRWIRSNEAASTARTPSSAVPLAAQSRDDPDPYSFPAMTSSGTPSAAYRWAASYMVICSPPGRCRVYPPSVPGASRLRSRMLANVPRIITSWLPRRDP